jgi:GntR family transcriptional regulator/MocR family aminotransferase
MQTMLSDLLLQRLGQQTEGPRNRELCRIFKETILDGSLAAGTRLPPTRELAKDLNISRNTVLYAYEQLLAEGYVVTRTGSGTYVADTTPDRALLGISCSDIHQPCDTEIYLSYRGSNLIANARASRQQWGAFMSGVPDVTLFPHKIWSQLTLKHWRSPGIDNMTYGHQGGHPRLKEALAKHLRMSRSLICTPEQILITDGIHQAINLCVHMLTDPQSRAWVEDPGYWGIRNILSALGVNIVGIPVDEEGMNPSQDVMKQPPRLIFMTPSHQYPLGYVMSLSRRRTLLEYANKHKAWIVEDDYDSEFRYGGRPLAALQGLEPNSRVLYTGTFSKTLFPGLRLGYLVVPPQMVDAFQRGLSELYREGRWMTQAILADFIEEGHYSSHIRRMRQLYGMRRNLLRAAVMRHIGESALLSADSNAGLHLAIGLPKGLQDHVIAKQAQQQGITALPLSRYYVQQAPVHGFVLGYGCVPDDRIDPAFSALAKIIRMAQE